ncbi:hypothetical protein [Amycolatopsis echigonensis]|uniref:Uncharacterized protein n=1 Tax=Amycolatopsis echigonensis TaxID=2576905 RepID=A0A8E2B278_9PSEU|nr:hypothetical protein [Amycolatopsis echigonensis]MBB2499307.1 hypothetical protein [Amycolatopsis echigonensis]
MRSRPPTADLRTGCACRTLDNAESVLRVEVDAHGRITLSGPVGAVLLTAEQVAVLRNLLGDALTVSLRDARTPRRRPT